MPINQDASRFPGQLGAIGRNITTWAVMTPVFCWGAAAIQARSGAQPPQFALTAHFSHSTSICALAFSTDGQRLAWGDCNGKVVLMDLATRRERIVATTNPGMPSIAFSPDNMILAIAGQDSREVGFWDVASAEKRFTLPIGADGLASVAFAPDGTKVAILDGSNGSITLWDYPSGKERIVLRGERKGLRDFTFSRDGRLLARTGWDGVVTLWETETGRQVAAISAHTGTVAVVGFSPDGTLLASASPEDKAVRLWSVPDGQPRGVISCPTGITALAFCPSGSLFVATAADGGFRSYDPLTGQERTSQRLEDGAIKVMTLSPDGRLLATGGLDHTVQLWDISRVLTTRVDREM